MDEYIEWFAARDENQDAADWEGWKVHVYS